MVQDIHLNLLFSKWWSSCSSIFVKNLPFSQWFELPPQYPLCPLIAYTTMSFFPFSFSSPNFLMHYFYFVTVYGICKFIFHPYSYLHLVLDAHLYIFECSPSVLLLNFSSQHLVGFNPLVDSSRRDDEYRIS